MPAPSSKGLGQERGFAVTALIPIVIGVLGSLVIIAIAVAIASSFGGKSSDFDPCAGGGNYNTSELAERMFAIAKGEIGNGRAKYLRFMGLPTHLAACASFASWVVNEAGVKPTPKYARTSNGGADSWRGWFLKNGGLHADPRPGDIAMRVEDVGNPLDSSWNGCGAHTMIVIRRVDSKRIEVYEWSGVVKRSVRNIRENDRCVRDNRGMRITTIFGTLGNTGTSRVTGTAGGAAGGAASSDCTGSNASNQSASGGKDWEARGQDTSNLGIKKSSMFYDYKKYIASTKSVDLSRYPDGRVDDIWGHPDVIVLHHTTTSGKASSVVNGFIQTFKEPNDRYHGDRHTIYVQYIVEKDGTIYQLLPETFAAHGVYKFHTTSRTDGSVGIVVNIENIGCFASPCNPIIGFTQAEVDSNIKLVKYLMNKWGIPITRVTGHMDVTRLGAPRNSSDPGWEFLNRVKAGIKQ